MMNNQKDELLIKLLLKSGQAIALYSSNETLCEMAYHPKFLKMRDDANEVFVSLEDVAAFEVMNNRKETPESDEGSKTS
jgi:hypothetical protein